MQKSLVTETWTLAKPVLALMLLLSMASCRSTSPVIVEHITHDSLLTTHVHYDSIYIQDSIREYISSPFKGDESGSEGSSSVRYHTEYRYRLLHDTTYINKVDTIPQVVTQTVTKTQKVIPRWCQFLSFLGVLFIGFFGYRVARLN